MTKKRDPRYTKTLGATPYVGRRYVAADKVRIEWREGGKRRSRTIGPNSTETRKEADKHLREILEGLEASDTVKTAADSTTEAQGAEAPESLETTLLGLADTLMDAADWLADGIRNAAREVMSAIEESDREDTDSETSNTN